MVVCERTGIVCSIREKEISKSVDVEANLMKIYLDFIQPIPQELIDAGAKLSTIIYMGELIQPPYDVVDLTLIRKTALKYEELGSSPVILDIEKVNYSSAVWALSNEATRLQGVALWVEVLTEFKKWYSGEVAMYGGHPSYWDYVAYKSLYPNNSDGIEQKWQYFTQWQSDIRPIINLTDFCCPSIYANVMFVVGGWTDDYALKQEWQAESYKLMEASIKHYHGYDKKIEWFINPNPNNGSNTHDDDFIDFQLTEISKKRDAAHIWMGPLPNYPALSDKMIGVIKGNL